MRDEGHARLAARVPLKFKAGIYGSVTSSMCRFPA
jgi:hypothetical protein